MKNKISNLGHTLNKLEQQKINGGVDCFDCTDYCIANSKGDRLIYGVCMEGCISQYC